MGALPCLVLAALVLEVGEVGVRDDVVARGPLEHARGLAGRHVNVDGVPRLFGRGGARRERRGSLQM